MRYLLFLLLLLSKLVATAQAPKFDIIKCNPATSVKDQGISGTCWCFSSTAMVESELLLNNQTATDLSEVFTVYNLFIDKAKNYIRRQGNARFTEGGLQQDMLYSTNTYGAVPQNIYPGVGKDYVLFKDLELQNKLKTYLDSLLKKYQDSIPLDWEVGYKSILNSFLGAPPATFYYNGKQYSPKTFADENVPLKLSNYIGLTSFTHHPFYTSFALEIPDNYKNNMYYNVSINELVKDVKQAIQAGYTVDWDADVSNSGFQQDKGFAKWTSNPTEANAFDTFTERKPTQEIRQELFDKQITQDDHLMQITGLAKDRNGYEYFVVKNSWGVKAGPYAGYIYVSIPYFSINTISVYLNKKALALDFQLKTAE